jgi:protoheme IX farnesyltransferase
MTAVAFLKHAAAICRAPIALFAACAAVTGYLLAPQRSLPSGVATALAVFILAAGASALNQYQERDIDARMERTRRRPLPAGIISPSRALSIALLLIFAGLSMLALAAGKGPAFLGMIALLWYNGAYTYLKRLTAFAAVPGAIVGMIPPVIGWTAAGGRLADPRLLVVCLLFFLWQVPHFWLQVLHHGEEYEQAGLPSLTTVLGKRQIARITFTWICSTAVTSLLLPLYGNLMSPLLYCPLLIAAVWMIVKDVNLMTARRTPALSRAAFRQLNIFIFIVMSLSSAEKMFFHLP